MDVFGDRFVNGFDCCVGGWVQRLHSIFSLFLILIDSHNALLMPIIVNVLLKDIFNCF